MAKSWIGVCRVRQGCFWCLMLDAYQDCHAHNHNITIFYVNIFLMDELGEAYLIILLISCLWWYDINVGVTSQTDGSADNKYQQERKDYETK